MNNFVRRVRAAWFFFRHFPSTQLPDNYWTNTDARALSNFLTSDTGIKLRHGWIEKVNTTAQRAIMEQSKPAYMCGVAWGTRAMVSWIDSLLVISPAPSELEHLTELEIEGEFRSVNR
jgi:hypothetical protein